MKRIYNLFFFMIVISVPSSAQKPAIDTGLLGKWPKVEKVGISNDGRHFFYLLDDRIRDRRVLTVASDQTGLDTVKIERVREGLTFTGDSKWGVFMNEHDSLGMLNLMASKVDYYTGVRSFKVSNGAEVPSVSFLSKGPENNLTVLGLHDGKEVKVPNVSEYLYDRLGNKLVIERNNNNDGVKAVEIIVYDLRTWNQRLVWKGREASWLLFDHLGRGLAFVGSDSSSGKNGIYYYRVTSSRNAVLLTDPTQIGKSIRMEVLNRPLQFSQRDDKVLFAMEKAKEMANNLVLGKSNVTIWSYKDEYLQSEQRADPDRFSELMNPTEFLYCADINNGHVVQLQMPGDVMQTMSGFEQNILITRTGGHGRLDQLTSIWFTSTSTGKREFIGSSHTLSQVALSPGGRFVTWFDGDSLVYWCYDVISGVKRNVTAMIPTLLFDAEAVKIGRRRAAFGIPVWLESDKAFLIYDKYDLWKADPLGMIPPTCITHEKGRLSHIVFGFVNTDASSGIEAESLTGVFSPGGQLILSGFNDISKDNGLWEISDLSNPKLKEMCYGPFCYYISRVGAFGYIEYPRWETLPQKAKDANVYLVCRMSAEEYPNWYLTKDLSNFHPLTHLHPERNYNWMRARLVSFHTLEGLTSEGILYQPQDFDSTKKYPLIFDYYEKRSDEFHDYLMPNFTSARIDIPYFVSNGYMVFVPDIYYKQGHNGEGLYSAVIGAARYLSKYSWVDSNRLGLQGHSFGGWETNYLITHSTNFRAACEAAGVSDQVSGYDELRYGSGGSRQDIYEITGQGSPYGSGVTPWTRPDLYMENSPIFYVHHIVTPLLMMQGNADAAVPFTQSIEMFLAMRRAGKKVWLLEYDKEGHVLSKRADQVDFTVRLKQFFDYYLMGGAPPIWMTKEVPFIRKDSEVGLGLDKTGAEP